MTIFLSLQKATFGSMTCGYPRPHLGDILGLRTKGSRRLRQGKLKSDVLLCFHRMNKRNKAAYGWARAVLGMTFCDMRGDGGWTNPRLVSSRGRPIKNWSKENARQCPRPPVGRFSFRQTRLIEVFNSSLYYGFKYLWLQ